MLVRALAGSPHQRALSEDLLRLNKFLSSPVRLPSVWTTSYMCVRQ